MEEGDGEDDRGEGVAIGLGRVAEESDSGVVPAEGGVEQGGGEEEREGVMGVGFGRGVWESTRVGDGGVGAGEGLAEGRGLCFDEEEQRAEGGCAAGVEDVYIAVLAHRGCAIGG